MWLIVFYILVVDTQVAVWDRSMRFDSRAQCEQFVNTHEHSMISSFMNTVRQGRGEHITLMEIACESKPSG